MDTGYSGSHNWDAVAQCESGGDWSINTGNGYSGGLQFANQYWKAMGGQTDYAWQASKSHQIEVAERILAVNGRGAWPDCGRFL